MAVKLTVVSTPAGFGKTTLLTDWLHDLASDPHDIWLVLDDYHVADGREVG